MVKRGSPLVEPPRVPRIGKPEQVEVQMVAELVPECAQERSE
jgi:hypothetical protein